MISNAETRFDSNAEAVYALGFQMLERERWADGADVFRAMMMAFPSDERAWLGLGRCHEQLGQVPVAINLYALACAAVRDTVRCRLALARALRHSGRDDESDEALDSAEAAAERVDDPHLHALVVHERRRQ